MGQGYANQEFDIVMAKFLVESCLNEDYLYYKFLEPIKNLDDYQFEELFKGNTDINYNIENSEEFSKLVYKFADYSKIFYYYHKDQRYHQHLIDLWKSNICIFELYNLTEDERKNKFKQIGLEYKFIFDLNHFFSTTLESKTESIFDYIKNEMSNLYSLISFATNEEKQLIKNPEKDNQSGSFHSNLSNIIAGLMACAFPFIKNYLSNIPLDPLSKKQMKNESWLAEFIKKHFSKSVKNSKVHQSLLDITKDFKYGKDIKNKLSKVKDFYYNPMVALTHLAISFLNLLKSIETFIDCRNEFKNDKKIYSRKLSQIYSDFLRHKEELKILDLNQAEDSIKIIENIHKKILNDKQKIQNLISQIKKKISKSNKKKIKGGVSLAINCLTFLSCAVGAMFTGGALLGVYIGAACLNGAAIAVNSVNIVQINNELDEYNKFIKEGIELEEEVNSVLKEIEQKIAFLKNEN